MGPDGTSTKLGEGYKGIIYDKDRVHEYKQAVKAILSSDKSDVVCRLMPVSAGQRGERKVAKDKYELPLTLVLNNANIPVYLNVDANTNAADANLRHDGGRRQWNMLNSKVYWILKRTLKNGDHILDSISKKAMAELHGTSSLEAMKTLKFELHVW